MACFPSLQFCSAPSGGYAGNAIRGVPFSAIRSSFSGFEKQCSFFSPDNLPLAYTTDSRMVDERRGSIQLSWLVYKVQGLFTLGRQRDSQTCHTGCGVLSSCLGVRHVCPSARQRPIAPYSYPFSFKRHQLWPNTNAQITYL